MIDVALVATRYSGITAGGQVISDQDGKRQVAIIQNVGTVTLEVYYTLDGSGAPVFILSAGAAANDGTGGSWADQWVGPLYVKAPAGGGAALIALY